MREARAEVAKLLHANADEIVFTRNATESLNLISYSLGSLVFCPGDEVLLSASWSITATFLVWQQAAKKNGRDTSLSRLYTGWKAYRRDGRSCDYR